MDPDALARAPLAVRHAAEVLADHERKKGRRALSALPLLFFFLGFPLAGLLATATGSEAMGFLAIPTMIAVSVATLLVLQRSFFGEVQQAMAVMQRWTDLESLGIAADLSPQVDADPGPIERLVARITAVGRDRPEVMVAARSASERAGRLLAELRHLDALVADGPDPVLEAARERIVVELTRIRGQLGELYATLLELAVPDDQQLVDASLERLAAEVEVVRHADRRQRDVQ